MDGESRTGMMRMGMAAAAALVALVPAAAALGDRPLGPEGGERVVVVRSGGAPLRDSLSIPGCPAPQEARP